MAVENPKEETIKVGSDIDTVALDIKKPKKQNDAPPAEKRIYDIDKTI
jgi:hypothetical protein